MKILIASDSFKGCMSSLEVANIIEKAAHDVNQNIEINKVVIADGGEGFEEAMCFDNGKLVKTKTMNKLLQPIETTYGVVNDTAIIEIAKVIGLVKKRGVLLEPRRYSSYGVGMLIKEIIFKGYKKIIIGLGGSATNDGGFGLLSALGVDFYDINDTKLFPKADNLIQIDHIDKSKMIDTSKCEFIVASDVRNHLLGENGATYIFGPQKGLKSEELELIEKGMENYANKIQEAFGVDINAYEGSGAAGGIGSVCYGILKAQMHFGIDMVLDHAGFDQLCQNSDVIFTGEGQTDAQSLQGKAVFGIVKRSKQFNKPVICISGALKDGYQKLYEYGVNGIYNITLAPINYTVAFEMARSNLYATAYSIISTLMIGEKK